MYIAIRYLLAMKITQARGARSQQAASQARKGPHWQVLLRACGACSSAAGTIYARAGPALSLLSSLPCRRAHADPLHASLQRQRHGAA
jgi:hypothetical protein